MALQALIWFDHCPNLIYSQIPIEFQKVFAMAKKNSARVVTVAWTPTGFNPNSKCGNFFCPEDHINLKYDKYYYVNTIGTRAILAAVAIAVDLQVCHKLSNLISLATSSILTNILYCSEKYFSAPSQNHNFNESKTFTPTTESLHANLHGTKPTSEHQGDHEHNHNHDHTFLNSLMEVGLEIVAGGLISLTLPGSLLQFTHKFDIMHLLPGWCEMENYLPFIANGHSVAETIFITLAVAGPVIDVGLRGIDAKQLADFYYNNGPAKSTVECLQKPLECSQAAIDYVAEFISGTYGSSKESPHSAEEHPNEHHQPHDTDF